MTSNIGSGHVAQTITKVGFKAEDEVQEFKERRDLVMSEVKKTLSPEFINRIDEVIVFDSLTEEQLGEIVRIMIRRLNESLVDRNTEIVVSDEVCRWLVQATCKDRIYGARPLRRAIRKHIEDALSDAIITGRFQGQGEIEVYLDGDKLKFRNPTTVPPG
jgi:ATP-dependent Clp protease ATP-binding subunit ClpC